MEASKGHFIRPFQRLVHFLLSDPSRCFIKSVKEEAVLVLLGPC